MCGGVKLDALACLKKANAAKVYPSHDLASFTVSFHHWQKLAKNFILYVCLQVLLNETINLIVSFKIYLFRLIVHWISEEWLHTTCCLFILLALEYFAQVFLSFLQMWWCVQLATESLRSFSGWTSKKMRTTDVAWKNILTSSLHIMTRCSR